MLKQILQKRKLSVYRLSKMAKLPYTTVNEIVLGKKSIEECNLKTIIAIANALNIPIESLYKENNIELSNSWQQVREKRYKFPDIVNDPQRDFSCFHPLKQKKLKVIYDLVSKDIRINKIIVFGSSLNIRCNKNSDIDIMIELNKEYINKKDKTDISDKISEKLDWNVDILWADRISKNSKLYGNIMKGEILYV